MVQSGAISGAKADAWRQRLADEEVVAKIRRAAEGGNVRAMITMAGWSMSGLKGLQKDVLQGFSWVKRAALEHEVAVLA